MRELQSDTVFRHYSRAKNSGIRFHVTAIPDEIPISEKSLDFDPARMKTLYDAGFKIGNAGAENGKVKPQSVLRETRQIASSQ